MFAIKEFVIQQTKVLVLKLKQFKPAASILIFNPIDFKIVIINYSSIL